MIASELLTATSLDALLVLVRNADLTDLSVERALSSLPTFGGAEPRNAHGVYSWDAGRLLVRTQTGWRIVLRTTALIQSAWGYVELGDA